MFNELASKVAAKEGGKVNLSIAQIKEVVRCTLQCLGEFKASEVLKLVEKYQG